MDFAQLVILALRLSIILIVFGFGLNATLAGLAHALRRPGLIARAILAIFVIMPIVAVLMARSFALDGVVKVALVALALSPVPPILPRKEAKAEGNMSLGLALLLVVAVASIGMIPLMLSVIGAIFDRDLGISPGVVTAAVMSSVVVPFVAGLVFRLLMPDVAARLEPGVDRLGKVLLPLVAAPVLIATAPEVWALIHNRSVLAFAIFTAVGLLVGHWLGGPDQNDAVVLGLSTACRHPAIALA